MDCASKNEIENVLSLGVKPNNIIFANPCKRIQDINTAAKNHIKLTTFDSESELIKLFTYYGSINCLLRIKADDKTARCQLGSKYGAKSDEIEKLLKMAYYLNINVIGVSFHVGSDAKNPQAYLNAISISNNVFDKANAIGHNMSILNIGGGFNNNLENISHVINSSLHKYFPGSRNTTFIAEPGRYFSENMSTLACKIIGKKINDNSIKYWITDGLYGSMNNIIYDKAVLSPTPFSMNKKKTQFNNIWTNM